MRLVARPPWHLQQTRSRDPWIWPATFRWSRRRRQCDGHSFCDGVEANTAAEPVADIWKKDGVWKHYDWTIKDGVWKHYDWTIKVAPTRVGSSCRQCDGHSFCEGVEANSVAEPVADIWKKVLAPMAPIATNLFAGEWSALRNPDLPKAVSTVFVTPIFEALAKVLDCNHDANGAHIASAPSIVCWQHGHQYLAVAAWGFGLFYFYMLLILTGSGGNVKDVERRSWCSPRKWLAARKMRDESVNLGPLQPNGDNTQVTAYVALMVKIALPCISIETTSRPLAQMGLSGILSVMACVAFAIWAPYKNAVMNAIALTPRLLHSVGFTIGFFAVLFDDKDKEAPIWPVVALYTGSTLILTVCGIYITFQLRKQTTNEDADSAPLMSQGEME